MVQKKRPLDLIQAVRLARSRRPERPLHILFVGAGELLDEARAHCRDHLNPFGESAPSPGLVDASFLGFLNQSQIAEAYVAADCLALPSESTETWGLVVNEAMACGLPAIVSDQCGCAQDLVAPFRPDLCFPTGDISGLADVIIAAMDNPQTPAEIASIIERYDILRTVETVEELYALAQSQRPGGR
jgi:glycosyltransferase involved in cell wall biosynthesis